MKLIVLCDNQAYCIEEKDFEKLQAIAPGLARLARDTDASKAATHFVCEKCGQICPVKIRELHACRK